ncbi:putative bifunctional diguanylate cyclase/phosphodiesterase [Sphingomonas sp. RS6]
MVEQAKTGRKTGFARRACVREMLDAIPSAVILVDRNHRLVEANRAFCAEAGGTRDFWLSAPLDSILPPDACARLRAEHERVFASGEDMESEEVLVNGEGRKRHLITRRRLIEIDGEPFILTVLSDVTAHREAEARSRYLAFHDDLTGLANRALLGERVRATLERNGGSNAALLLIDIDRFKDINDAFGHAAGDALLRAFADRLAGIARGSDTVARLGGDEFAILLGDIETAADAEAACRRVAALGEQPFAIASGAVSLELTVGGAWAAPGVDSCELQRRADLALGEAKRDHEKSCCVFGDDLAERLRQRKLLEADLRAALDAGGQLEVHYQPVMGASGDEVAGMEALVRWQHPTLGLLGPNSFITIAEQSGLIVRLGEWVLDQAVAMMAHFPGVSIAVNLSPVQLRSQGVDDYILASLAAHGMPPSQLQLEITESAMLAVDAGVQARLQRLRGAGVQLVLDDFGTGYSSLSHLHRLSVDRVKIDQSFVRELGESHDARAIIQAVLGIGHALGIGVTAEGVEDEKQRIFLRAFGCHEFQGYLFSRPLTCSDAVTFLESYAKRRAA